MKSHDLLKSSEPCAKAETVMNGPKRTRTAYLTLIVWAAALYMLSDLNLPTIVINILWLLTGTVFALTIEAWYLSRRLEAAITVLKLKGYEG